MNLKNIVGGLHRRYKFITDILYKKRAISDSKKKKKYILNNKRNKKNQQIKVGFIVQMPEIWDKEAPLFEAMVDDGRFDACLIIVPHYDFANSRLGK